MGVARPSAHGQAMISTATAAVNAAAGRLPGEQPAGQGHERDDEHEGHEHRGDPVGQPLHGRLAALRLGDQPRHLGELGVGAHAVARTTSRPPAFTVAPMTPSPGPTSTGTDSPVSIEASTADAALLDHPVGGDLLAGPHHEAVADHQRVERHPLLGAVAQHGDVLGAELEQRPQRRARAPLGPRLEVAARAG